MNSSWISGLISGTAAEDSGELVAKETKRGLFLGRNVVDFGWLLMVAVENSGGRSEMEAKFMVAIVGTSLTGSSAARIKDA